MKNNVSLSLAGILLGTSVPCGAKEKPACPHIIILTADDLGWNDVSSLVSTRGNGSKNHQTPNIDRLMKQGMTFTSAYTQQNSAPTRAALLTGQYANHTGVYNVASLARYGNGKKGSVSEAQARIVPPEQRESIDPQTVTFAEMLSQNGYETYIFGKVHGWSGDLFRNHGFKHDYSCSKTVRRKDEKYRNYLAAKQNDGTWIFDNEAYNRYAQPYTKAYIEKNLSRVANGNDPAKLVGSTKHFTDAIGDCVIEQIADADKNKPFCMWVCFHAIHSTIVGRQDLYDKYKGRSSLDERHADFKYAALTEQMDQTVGRIMAALDDPNGDGDHSDSMSANTIIVFMSDNGGIGGHHSNTPLRGEKGTFYEGGFRVPFTVSYPAVIAANSISDEPIHVIDFFPTLAALTHCKMPEINIHKVDGESFAPILKGEQKRLKRDALYWHFPGYLDERQVPSTAINKRVGDKRYKLKYSYETEVYELYCLSDDLSEQHNLLLGSSSSQVSEIAKKLREDMCNWLAKNPPLKMHYRNSGLEVGMPKEL